MRILLATETYHPTISGAVVFCDTLAEELTRRGHDVAIFAPSPNRTYRTFTRNGITVYQFKSLPVPLRPKARFVVREYARVIEAFTDFNPDIVHLQSPSGVPLAVLRHANTLGVPVVATHHFSLEFVLAYFKRLAFMNPITQLALIHYFKWVYDRCDLVTCPTTTIQNQLLNAGLDVSMRVISNGIDLDKYSNCAPNLPAGVPHNKKYLLYVGRIDKDKSIPVLLEAMPYILEEVPDAHLLLAGTGSEVDTLKKWVNQSYLQDSVTFLGKIERTTNAIPELYASASVFMIASTIETQCLAIMEALASGVPVIGVDAGAIPELVVPDVTGYLVKPEDSAAIARAACRILKDEALHDRLSHQARAHIKPHTLPATIDLFEQHYLQLLAMRESLREKQA